MKNQTLFHLFFLVVLTVQQLWANTHHLATFANLTKRLRLHV